MKNEIYKAINETQLKAFLKSCNIHIARNNKCVNPDIQFILETFSGRNSFDEIKDYKDHRKDTDKQLLKLLKDSQKTSHRLLQKGNYIDSNGEPVTDLILSGSDCGWTCAFVYKSGKNAFGK